ncbi:MAG: hypothetical protein IJU00_02590 [Selenomonas sp.]|nr:hypothetical protein [Selenomonas sp.]
MAEKISFTAGGKPIFLYPAGKTAPLVLLHTVHGEGDRVYRAVHDLTDKDFSFAAVDGLEWDNEMSPWPIPPIAKNDTPCNGGADVHLERLLAEILPAIKARLPHPPAYSALAGYSLAGLFALYAAYKTAAFSRLACASGSFWYPAFYEFVCENSMPKSPQKIYFSLGDKEARTRNEILKTVEENTRRLVRHYEQKGIKTIFELNPGNHFHQGIERMAKGIAWVLE